MVQAAIDKKKTLDVEGSPSKEGSNQIMFLELDTLDSGDVFCHTQVMNKVTMDHSVVTCLPTELYSIPANDFLLLCKDLLHDFKRYNKGYPNAKQIKSMYEQDRKWQDYKTCLLNQIQINKKLSKFSFDYILRQNDIKMPRTVHYTPISKIQNLHKKRTKD